MKAKCINKKGWIRDSTKEKVDGPVIQLDGGIPDTDTINEAERKSIVPNPHVHPIFQDILKTALHV